MIYLDIYTFLSFPQIYECAFITMRKRKMKERERERVRERERKREREREKREREMLLSFGSRACKTLAI